MSLTRLVLKFAAPLPDIEGFSRVLFIGPHPDDIEIGAGATAAKLAAKGVQICFLICIDGRYGDAAIPGEISPEELAKLRKKEAVQSAALLGVEDVRFLELCDGAFYNQDELVRGIAEIVGDFKPQLIFAPDPCVSSECHKDHLNVGNAAREIACFASFSNIMAGYGAQRAPVDAIAYYMTAKPNTYVKTSGYFEKQLEAIFSCHISQFSQGSDGARAVELYLKLRAFDYGIRTLSRHGEGFRVLGQTHMHCLPEAGN